MATKLWKDGKAQFFATESVQQAIKAGWATTPKAEPKAEPKTSTKSK